MQLILNLLCFHLDLLSVLEHLMVLLLIQILAPFGFYFGFSTWYLRKLHCLRFCWIKYEIWILTFPWISIFTANIQPLKIDAWNTIIHHQNTKLKQLKEAPSPKPIIQNICLPICCFCSVKCQ